MGAEFRRIGLAAVALWCLTGCSNRSADSRGFNGNGWTYPASIDSVFPADAQTAFKAPERVEVALVEGYLEPEKRVGEVLGPPGERIWELRSEWKALAPEQAKTLRTLLVARKTWQVEAKPCTFNPNVAVRWISGADTTNAIFCHGCNDMMGWRDSVRFGGHFDPAGAELLALDRSFFPADSVLDAIAARKAD